MDLFIQGQNTRGGTDARIKRKGHDTRQNKRNSGHHRLVQSASNYK